jgi:hypothetical protein
MHAAAYRTLRSLPPALAFIATSVAVGGAGVANAEVVQCGGAATCSSSFSIFLGGSTTEAGGGQLTYNAQTGAISLDLENNLRGGAMVVRDDGNTPVGLMWNLGNGGSVSVNGLGGNADPILGFSVGTTTGAASATVAFVFDLPITLAGNILADARVSYTLTSLSAAGAQISPVVGSTTVVDAFDLDTIGGASLPIDKGVDVGSTFSVAAFDSAGSPSYSAVNFFTVDPTYDVMRVIIGYSLTPESLVGVTGFVRQVVVPLPAALPLLLASLTAFGALARRRRPVDAPL